MRLRLFAAERHERGQTAQTSQRQRGRFRDTRKFSARILKSGGGFFQILDIGDMQDGASGNHARD